MIEKMKLVNIVGSLSSFDEMSSICISGGDFQPENTEIFLENKAGFYNFSEQNPYNEAQKLISEFASQTKIELKFLDATTIQATQNDIIMSALIWSPFGKCAD